MSNINTEFCMYIILETLFSCEIFLEPRAFLLDIRLKNPCEHFKIRLLEVFNNLYKVTKKIKEIIFKIFLTKNILRQKGFYLYKNFHHI